MHIETIHLVPERDDVTLTTYIHKSSPELLPGYRRPAILICPGGAYFSCSDREGEPVALRFAAMGYQAYVLTYSTYLEGKGGFPPFDQPVQPKADRVFPTPAVEIGLALQYIRDNADAWDTDPNRIILCGFSAGAHNCAMYATRWADPVLTERLGGRAAVVRPAGAILGYPLTDYVAMRDEGTRSANAEESAFLQQFFAMSNTAYLGVANPDEELLEEVSPARHVNENTPPIFLWATADDNLVPSFHSLLMAQALQAQGIPFALHLFESGPHGLSLATQATASSRAELNPDAAAWVPLCEDWLIRHFPLELPELMR